MNIKDLLPILPKDRDNTSYRVEVLLPKRAKSGYLRYYGGNLDRIITDEKEWLGKSVALITGEDLLNGGYDGVLKIYLVEENQDV